MKYGVVTRHTPQFDKVEDAEAWARRHNGAVGDTDVPCRVVRLVELTEDFTATEKAYVEGANMARRLLRLQLGLAVPEDRF